MNKAKFRETRERCGISQKMLADRFGNAIRTVKRWEKPGDAEPPSDIQEWLEGMLAAHVEAVKASLDAAESMLDELGEAHHVNLLYYRSQAHYDQYGRDSGNFSVVNARTREVGAILEANGVEVRYLYPEDDEMVFQQLASTR